MLRRINLVFYDPEPMIRSVMPRAWVALGTFQLFNNDFAFHIGENNLKMCMGWSGVIGPDLTEIERKMIATDDSIKWNSRRNEMC